MMAPDESQKHMRERKMDIEYRESYSPYAVCKICQCLVLDDTAGKIGHKIWHENLATAAQDASRANMMTTKIG